ncbi:GTP binding [Forsythia ovata]|uniref:GTP binding n=1 Tax=Forsythia ovata TaxID=205694 RepID=A0ABD1TPY2_9LAMI
MVVLSSDLADHVISETEGNSLLGDEESSPEITKSCLEWCIEHIIEYIEACASNADFDKCLSIDGDSQGVERLYGALSAHMWPRMSLKSGDKIIEPSLPEQEDGPDESKTYDFEDVEMLMSENGNMRSSLRLMPDFQMRETAAKLAMKMAAMFGNSSGGEEGFD